MSNIIYLAKHTPRRDILQTRPNMTQDAPQHAELQVGAVSTDATTDMTKSATSKSYVTFTPRLGQDSGASIDQGSVQEQYRTYKMRWLGLGVLTLLNMMVSWAVCFFLRAW